MKRYKLLVVEKKSNRWEEMRWDAAQVSGTLHLNKYFLKDVLK